jgi:hypothetical protein
MGCCRARDSSVRGLAVLVPLLVKPRIRLLSTRMTAYEHAKLNCCSCWGDHSWIKHGKIVCPPGTEPQVLKNAEEKNNAYKNDLTKHGVKPMKKRCKVVEFKVLD